MQSDQVRLFGPSASLGDVVDRTSGTYFVPEVNAGFPDSQFDPATWSARADMPPVLWATLDTGVVQEHPLLKPRIAEASDFTGDDAEDHDGHGSKVALLLVLEAPFARLLVGKVVGRDAAPFSEQLDRINRGIRWAVKRHARVLSLSVGVASGCSNAAALCQTIRYALDSGLEVLVAAEARCPAECDERIDVIGYLNVRTGKPSGGAAPDFVVPVTDQPLLIPMLPYGDWFARLEGRTRLE